MSYLQFVTVELKGDVKFNYIVNNKQGTHLGYINYYPPWRRYVFTTIPSEVILDMTCMLEIIQFIDDIPK
jgi:hypothetical protein